MEDREVHQGFWDTIGDGAANLFHGIGSFVNSGINPYGDDPGRRTTGLNDEKGITRAADGQITSYINEQGQRVQVYGSGIDDQLRLYGRETTDKNGNVSAGYSLTDSWNIFWDSVGGDGSLGLAGC
jgi:hypothetical protein